MGDIHAIADHKQIGTDEADVLGLERLRQLSRLLQKHRDSDAGGAALLHQLFGEGDGAARFEDVIDEEHVAAGDIAVDIADELHLAGRFRAGLVARERDEFDLGREPDRVQRADEIGSEDEAPL